MANIKIKIQPWANEDDISDIIAQAATPAGKPAYAATVIRDANNKVVEVQVGLPGYEWLDVITGDWIAWKGTIWEVESCSAPKIVVRNLDTGEKEASGPFRTSEAKIVPKGQLDTVKVLYGDGPKNEAIS